MRVRASDTLSLRARLFATPLDELDVPAGPWGSAKAAPAPGRTTSTTGTGSESSSASMAAAEAVLHATTISFGENRIRKPASSRAKRRMVWSDLIP